VPARIVQGTTQHGCSNAASAVVQHEMGR